MVYVDVNKVVILCIVGEKYIESMLLKSFKVNEYIYWLMFFDVKFF